MVIRVSPEGIAELAQHEGIVPYRYRDSQDIWTFGIGHTAAAGPPDPAGFPLGQEQPMSMVLEVFRRDLAHFEGRVSEAVRVSLAQHEFDALVSFDYNTGGIHRARLTRLLNEGRRAEAAEAFMGWSRPPEIIPRRRKEQALFRDGTYSSGGFANVYPADGQGRVLWSQGRRVNVLDLLSAVPVG